MSFNSVLWLSMLAGQILWFVWVFWHFINQTIHAFFFLAEYFFHFMNEFGECKQQNYTLKSVCKSSVQTQKEFGETFKLGDKCDYIETAQPQPSRNLLSQYSLMNWKEAEMHLVYKLWTK